MNQRLDCVAMVVGDDRQGAQSVGFESIDGALARFPVEPLVGDFGEPLPCLAVDIVQVRELSQGPEILACIPDGPLDFSFGADCRMHRVRTVRGSDSV